jgi:hypothetical protein
MPWSVSPNTYKSFSINLRPITPINTNTQPTDYLYHENSHPTKQPTTIKQDASDLRSSCGSRPRSRQPSQQTERLRLQPGPPVPRGRAMRLYRWPPRFRHSHSDTLNCCAGLRLQPSPPVPRRCQVCLHQRRSVFGDTSRYQHWIRMQPSTLLP